MHKLIIVDDEKMVRTGLRDTVNWRKYGFTVVGAARNGLEAVDMIREKCPAVVLTDIKMPEMDGIRLAKVIKEAYPGVKTVLLSAYNDFGYAQDAIKYNVKAYLLKPLKEEEIREVFCALNEEINNENALQSCNPYEKEHGLRSLITGLGTEHVFASPDRRKQLHLFEYSRVAVCSFVWNKAVPSDERMKNDIHEQACAYSARKGLSILLFMNQWVIFLSSPQRIGKEEVNSVILDFKQFIFREMGNRFPPGVSCVFGVGNMCSGLEMLQRSYAEALYAYNYKYFASNQEIIFYQEVQQSSADDTDHKKFDAILDRLIDCIFRHDPDEMMAHIRTYFESVNKRDSSSIEEIRLKCMEIVFAIDLKVREKGLDAISIDKKELLYRIKEIDSYEGLMRWMGAVALDTSQQIKNCAADNTSWLIKHVKEYVTKHYYEKITLEDMARLCYTNPSYLSFRFKKVTGENFSDFVARIKIEKSIDLLLYSDYKLQEISEMVGFEDYSYFSKVFKKYKGMTPLKFRAKVISPNLNDK